MGQSHGDKGVGKGRRIVAVLALSLLVLCATASAASAAADGKTRFTFNATSDVIHWVTGGTPDQRAWMNETYWRERGYPPYHTNIGALAGAPPTDFYQDFYAIYNDNRRGGEPDLQTLAEHPDWVLRDGQGRPMFIPWACGGTSCTQYAADITNAGWRRDWIDRAIAHMSDGYAGVYIDDVNLEMMVGNGAGDLVAPIDPNTGAPMTKSNWSGYIASFVEQVEREVKAVHPNAVITLNLGQWWGSHDDPEMKRVVTAADTIELERGLNDQGLAPGGGTYGFNTFLAHIDWIHAMGADVSYQPYDLNAQSAMFNLAGYLVMQDGDDSITTEYRAEPDNWWTGWETDLGPATSERYTWNGLIRRDFRDGSALINPVGGKSVTTELTGYDLDGKRVDSVSLGAREGVILTNVSGGANGDSKPEAKGSGIVKIKRVTLKRGRVIVKGKAGAKTKVTLLRKDGGWRAASRGRANRRGTFTIKARAHSAGAMLYRATTPTMKSSRAVRIRADK